MTTNKQFSLSNNKTISEVKQGDILKRYNDLFILSRVEDGKRETIDYSDPVRNALFYGSGYSAVEHKGIRKEESKYNLISLSTGGRFFDENFSLSRLLYKMTDMKFKVVEKIEFKED